MGRWQDITITEAIQSIGRLFSHTPEQPSQTPNSKLPNSKLSNSPPSNALSEAEFARLFPPTPPDLEETVFLTRPQIVGLLLDEAWTRGITGYNDLLAYVKQHSGTGCSRRAIADWKRERGLIHDQYHRRSA